MPTLTLAQANKIVEVALAKAREMKIRPLAVAVLDQSGHVKSLQREDGASMFRCDIAVGKAWASVGMGVASRALLGAAGASGGTGDEDEAACIAGVQAAGLIAS
jgi:uncharacterized protein GlcG (DUF336 family)